MHHFCKLEENIAFTHQELVEFLAPSIGKAISWQQCKVAITQHYTGAGYVKCHDYREANFPD